MISNIDLSNNTKLEHLDIADNNFSKQDLSFLKDLANLEMVTLGNSDESRKKKGTYNRFFGGLENLKNMNRLVSYSINGTEIDDSDQTHIKNNAKSFVCHTKARVHTQTSTAGSIFGFVSSDQSRRTSSITWDGIS